MYKVNGISSIFNSCASLYRFIKYLERSKPSAPIGLDKLRNVTVLLLTLPVVPSSILSLDKSKIGKLY